jgi:hypothetical protein
MAMNVSVVKLKPSSRAGLGIAASKSNDLTQNGYGFPASRRMEVEAQ